ncbi:MAG: hypothetical protein GY943_27660, partial [Chloroflexi bacterium]|nr:hypothetical protein [Chloroflexota bacterium]
IAACFMSGSYGRRREDGFSDMDVALVYVSEFQRDAAWRNRQEFVKSITPYVPSKSFDAEHVRPFFHIVLYGNGTKIDFRFETKESCQPNSWDRDIRILKDNHGWAEQYQAASAQLSMVQPRFTQAELVALDDRFWIMFWDVFRVLLRGDHDKPFTVYLELMYFTLPTFLQLLPPEDAARQALLAAQFSKNTGGTAVHLSTLLTAYINARASIIKRYHLDFMPDTQFERQIKDLIKKKLQL